MSTEYFVNSHINIFHSLPFSLQSIQLLGSLLTVEEVCVNFPGRPGDTSKTDIDTRWGFEGQSDRARPRQCNEVLFTPNYKHWSLVETDLSWACLTTSIRVTCYHNGPDQCQARQLIKHQNRHFLLADGRRRLPVCPGHNYQRIPVFLSPLSLNTTLAGVGQWTVESADWQPGSWTAGN